MIYLMYPDYTLLQRTHPSLLTLFKAFTHWNSQINDWKIIIIEYFQ